VGGGPRWFSRSPFAVTFARAEKNPLPPPPPHMPGRPAAWSSVGLGGAILRRYVIWPKPFACKRTNSGGSCKRIIHCLQAIGLFLQFERSHPVVY